MGRIYQRDGRWGIDYVDARGNRVRRIVAKDKSVAQKLLADAQVASEKIRAGVLLADPSEARRPLTEHLRSYIHELERRGRAPMYRYNVERHISIAAMRQGWSTLGDCSRSGVTAFLRSLIQAGKHPKTVNAYLADLSAFCGWCTRTGRLEANPCEGIEKTADKRAKTRRALSVRECRLLLAASPPDRSLVYHTLLVTGLRRGEAERLRWADVRLDALNPHIELPPSITKSGQPESIPLVSDLAEALRRARDPRGRRTEQRESDGSLASPMFDRIPSMPEFRADLASAGIEEVDARGRRVVLHSLRHSLATMLAGSGVPMAIAQRILRHRDIRLTAEVYTDEGLLPLSAAMGALPSFAAPGHAAPALRCDRTA